MILQKLRPMMARLIRIPYWVPLYAAAIYLALVFASYSRHWKEWPARVHAEQMPKLQTVVEGQVEDLSTFGWGLYKDYFIQVRGYEFHLPGSIANAKLRPDTAPVTDIDSKVDEGTYVVLDVLGRKNPVVVGIAVRQADGNQLRLLASDVGVRRFELMYRNAPTQANHYQHLVWRLIGGAILLHLLIFGYRRMRRSKSATR